MDQYINFDPSHLLPTPAYSPESSRSKSIPTPAQPVDYANNILPTRSSQQTFAGPSHQYELHKQQTGLPVGALANTIAINQADHIVYGQAQRMFGGLSTDAYYDDLFDFNTAPSQNVGNDMDLDFNSPLLDMNPDFIDPSAVGGQENSVTSSLPAKQRAWPGMHQQQAAMAKAQAEAEAEAQQQRQQAVSPQRPSQTPRQPSQRSGSNTAPAKDPIVEERISRLLNQMRHNSVASSKDDAPTPTAHGSISHLGRAKKDEEDMDEDERLLASEEGKKLSSKERRQLRNKVSARAFRSRRKEYIGQLEGEIAAKTAEADELRAKNQDLMAENTRLTDLTRMLLESSAFSTFLNELSGTNDHASVSSADSRPQATAPRLEESRQDAPKDINPHQPSLPSQNEQGDARVGMVLMPEASANFGATNTAWVDNTDFSLYDAQVYAVTSMPEGPAVDHFDASLLFGKSSDITTSIIGDEVKQEVPVLEPPLLPAEECKDHPTIVGGSKAIENQSGEPDAAFALFDDAPPALESDSAGSKDIVVNGIQPEKAVDHIELKVVGDDTEAGEVSAAAMRRFLRFCANMEDPSRRDSAGRCYEAYEQRIHDKWE
ncbi:MAG: hypothetical protein Q9201_004312 [Fulgogasparrea decipioides]